MLPIIPAVQAHRYPRAHDALERCHGRPDNVVGAVRRARSVFERATAHARASSLLTRRGTSPRGSTTLLNFPNYAPTGFGTRVRTPSRLRHSARGVWFSSELVSS